MKFQSVAILGLASVCACKSGATPQPAASAVATNSTIDVSVSSEASPSTNLDSESPTLPRLKPVTGKLFPEGTTEAMICEAVNVKEPDLWLRFGHMIPMFVRGTVVVLQAGTTREADIAAFANWYRPRFEPVQASCGDKTLLHIEGLDDDTAALEELEARLGIKVLERFDLPVDDRQHHRLSDYCRTDAVLCNDLRNLYYGSRGNGVCGWAISDCWFEYDSKDYVEAVARCVTQPPDQVVCASILGTPSENELCTKRIRELHCPDFPRRAKIIGRRPVAQP